MIRLHFLTVPQNGFQFGNKSMDLGVVGLFVQSHFVVVRTLSVQTVGHFLLDVGP